MLSVHKTDQATGSRTLSGRIDTEEELMQVAEVLETEVYADDGGKYFFIVNHRPLNYDPIMYRVTMSAQVRVGSWIALDRLPTSARLEGFHHLAF